MQNDNEGQSLVKAINKISSISTDDNATAKILYIQLIRGQVDRASATEAVYLGLNPSQVKPKTTKIGIHSFPA